MVAYRLEINSPPGGHYLQKANKKSIDIQVGPPKLLLRSTEAIDFKRMALYARYPNYTSIDQLAWARPILRRWYQNLPEVDPILLHFQEIGIDYG